MTAQPSPRSAPQPTSYTYPPSAPKPPACPRSPPANTSPTWDSWPRSCPPKSTTAPTGAAPGAFNEAKFPSLKRLADFNVDAAPTISAATLGHLAAGNYMDAGEPVVLLGHSGTGKSHLLISLGLAACEQGRRVRYVTTAQLVNDLVEAADDRVLSRVVGRYGRLDLLCLDELGYVKIDPRGAELLFQIITEREERASIAIATNLPFSEWGTVFPDPRLVAAIVDRVTFNAHILETGTQSYRLRTSKTKTTTNDHVAPQRLSTPRKRPAQNRPTALAPAQQGPS
jgi:DNA replication protein DnaC